MVLQKRYPQVLENRWDKASYPSHIEYKLPSGWVFQELYTEYEYVEMWRTT